MSFIFLVLLVSVFSLIGMYCTSKDQPVGVILKTIAMAILVSNSIYFVCENYTIYKLLFVISLFMAMTGDFFLGIMTTFKKDKKDLWFMIGLGFFAIAYILMNFGLFVNSLQWIYIIPMVIFAIAMVCQLLMFELKGAMFPIVFFYMAIMSFLAVKAIWTFSDFAVVGALSLYVSDSLIGHNVFNPQSKFSKTFAEFSVGCTFYFGLVCMFFHFFCA